MVKIRGTGYESPKWVPLGNHSAEWFLNTELIMKKILFKSNPFHCHQGVWQQANSMFAGNYFVHTHTDTCACLSSVYCILERFKLGHFGHVYYGKCGMRVQLRFGCFTLPGLELFFPPLFLPHCACCRTLMLCKYSKAPSVLHLTTLCLPMLAVPQNVSWRALTCLVP